MKEPKILANNRKEHPGENQHVTRIHMTLGGKVGTLSGKKKSESCFFDRFYNNMIFTFFSKKKSQITPSTGSILTVFKTILTSFFLYHRCQERVFFNKKNKKTKKSHISTDEMI